MSGSRASRLLVAHRGRLKVAVIAVAILAAGLVALRMAHVWPREGVDRVRHLVRWPNSCADIATEPVAHLQRLWPRAREAETVECEMAGPWIAYVRFGRAADARHDLLSRPPSSATCVADREVLIDGLDGRQFAQVCHRFGGIDVDAVSGLPDIGGGVTPAEVDKSVRAEDKRDTRAELRALRAYWKRR